MTGPYNFSVLISQMPRVQKMQGNFQAFAEMTQGHLAREVIAKQEREQHQVPRTEAGEETVRAKPEQEGGKRDADRRFSRSGSESSSEEDSGGTSPDSGRLLDIEV
jgi:hypothetical protein